MRSFRRTIGKGGFAVTAELALKSQSTAADVKRQAALFSGKVDAIQVADNPLAWVQMSPLAASAVLMREGVDAMPILTCRDRNRIGLFGDLLGLHALGVESLLLTRGRRVGRRHRLHASTVFDLTGRELIAMASGIADSAGLDHPSPFLVGTGAKVHRAADGWTADALAARAEAGAEFLQTQVCYDLDLLGAWLEKLVAARMTWRFSVIVSLAVLPSVDTARWVREQMSDSRIPDSLVERLDAAADPESEGVAACAETLRAIAAMPGVSGVNLLSTGNPELAAAAIEAAGPLEPAGRAAGGSPPP